MGSFTSLSKLYFEQGKWRELTSLYKQTRKQGIQPNSYTITSLLTFSSSLPLPLHQGKSLHADALKTGFVESDNYVLNALMIMYTQCSSLINAHKLFDEIPLPTLVNWNTIISSFLRAKECDGARRIFDQMRETHSPNDVTWSAMISGYTQNCLPKDALSIFKQMRGEFDEMGSSLSPTSHTIASLYSACAQLHDLRTGEQVHGYTRKISAYIENDVFVGCALIDLYGKCCRQELAKVIFDYMIEKCVVAWSVFIATYIRNGFPTFAIEAFREMVRNGVEPNNVTLSTLLTACADMAKLILGKELHGYIIRRGDMMSDVFVSTSLIDMYGKCRCMVYGRRILETSRSFLKCDAIPMWNAMISGYAENNCFDDAWGMLRSMNKDSDTKPNSVTMAIVLPLCTRFSKLLHGKELHCYSLKSGSDKEIFVGNSLLDMYSKCGKLHMAENQFKRMTETNTVSWTSMIDGYGIHGNAEGAIKVFECMAKDNVKPDHVTFVALVSACSHAGLVEEGLKYFEAMTKEYGIIPTEENYGSVVDLLARAGRLKEAKHFIANMPIEPGANVWGALLSACKIHGNVEEAECAAERLLHLEPNEGGFRKLLSSIYSDSGNLDNVAEVRSTMREIGVTKRQGFSWLETNQGICGFVAGQSR